MARVRLPPLGECVTHTGEPLWEGAVSIVLVPLVTLIRH